MRSTQPTSRRQDRRLVGRAFDAAVGRPVVRFTVPVALAVGLVVLLLVRHEVGKRETVVGGHEIHARERRPTVMVVQVG